MFSEAIPKATKETMMLHKPNWHAGNHSFNLNFSLGKSTNPSQDYSWWLDYQAQCACVECVGLTCPTSSGFCVINVQLWQTTRQQNWLSSVCKLMYCLDPVLPQCGRKLRVVWIKPAQKGLKLCYTCKASHAQNPAQNKYCWTVPQNVLLQVLVLAHFGMHK